MARIVIDLPTARLAFTFDETGLTLSQFVGEELTPVFTDTIPYTEMLDISPSKEA